MSEYIEPERFIPFQKTEIVRLLCEDGYLTPSKQKKFHNVCRLLESIFHFIFHEKIECLKRNYYPLNPDKITKTTKNYSSNDINESEKKLLEKFEEILNDANYEKITQDDLNYAIEKASLFKINLFVDFDDFESQIIYRKGVREEKNIQKRLFRKPVKTGITVFDRVALLIKFKDNAYFESQKRKDLKFKPGSMIIKLFKNIPKADMEMMFPNTQVRMRYRDIFFMIVCALGGGVAVVLKASAGLIAMFSVLWFLTRSFIYTGGDIPPLGPTEISCMVGGISALTAIIAFLVKHWNDYKNRIIKFMKDLGDNLYFKNLDNNAGVFHYILNEAEEEECKEAILSYYFLLRSENGLTSSELDNDIEQWFAKKYDTVIDFEISDALRKLKKFDLCKTIQTDQHGNKVWQAVSLDDACTQLDYIWDNFFQFNQCAYEKG
jgi:hypothetical protein